MGYRSNDKKPAYEFHGLKWDKFEEKINQLESLNQSLKKSLDER